jgi:hypothetical protein
LQDLEAAGSKVLGGDPAKARRVQDLRNEVSKLECSIAASTAEYTRISDVNRQVRDVCLRAAWIGVYVVGYGKDVAALGFGAWLWQQIRLG